MRRHHVASPSARRHIYVVFPLGSDPTRFRGVFDHMQVTGCLVFSDVTSNASGRLPVGGESDMARISLIQDTGYTRSQESEIAD